MKVIATRDIRSSTMCSGVNCNIMNLNVSEAESKCKIIDGCRKCHKNKKNEGIKIL